jgi:hypothetical protein
MPSVFVSYSTKNSSFARQLATSLSSLGIDVWMDVDDIPPGMRWSTAIQRGLDVSDLMIVVITPQSMVSRHVEDEWQYFLDNGKPVVPLLLTPAKVHYQLSRIQYIDFYRNDYRAAFKQLHAEMLRRGFNLIVDTNEIRAIQIEPHQPLATIEGTDGRSRKTRPSNRSTATRPSRLSVYNVPTQPTRIVWEATRPVAIIRRKWGLLALWGIVSLFIAMTLIEFSGEGATGLLATTPDAQPVVLIGAAVEAETLPESTPDSLADILPEITTLFGSAAYATVTNADAASLREGPSVSFARHSMARRGTALRVVGRNPLRTWYLVETAENSLLWVSATLTRLEPDDANLPIIRLIGTVTMGSNGSVHTDTSTDSTTLAILPADSLLPMTGAESDFRGESWYRVVLADGQSGWVSAAVATPRFSR